MWYLIAVLVLIVLYCLWQWKFIHRAVPEMVKGIVFEDPQVLADKAQADLETYSLARVGQSEEGLSSDRAKYAVMQACLNHSRATGQSITSLVTAGNKDRSDYAQANGRYGRQGIHPYCTTIADPKQRTIRMAQEVIDGTVNDETEGAEWWDNPIAQMALHLANPWSETNKGGYRHPDEIAERRTQKGLRMVNIPGVSTRFWTKG